MHEVIVTGSSVDVYNALPSVTNVQHAGVDEGAIVKVHGEHLVVLRRGRLLSVRIGADELRSVAALDAFGPQLHAACAWYDEMLISGDTIAVIGRRRALRAAARRHGIAAAHRCTVVVPGAGR